MALDVLDVYERHVLIHATFDIETRTKIINTIIALRGKVMELIATNKSPERNTKSTIERGKEKEVQETTEEWEALLVEINANDPTDYKEEKKRRKPANQKS